jgi:hypothetical protein
MQLRKNTAAVSGSARPLPLGPINSRLPQLAASSSKKVAHDGARGIEQPHNDPDMRVPMNRPHEKVGGASTRYWPLSIPNVPF